MRKTKIICTLGPATDGILPEMIKAGMNVARMNFSHGSHEEHKARMDAVKAARKELGMPVGIMLDTKGPEIRTKTYKDGKIEIVEGQEFTLTTRDIEGDNTIVSITYEGLPNDVQPGTRILIDDGLVAFEVLKIVDGTDIICKALNGGPLSNRKSINVPGIKLNMKFISDKDREDIEFGLTQDIDFIAASFTRCAQDVRDIKAILKAHGKEDVEIICKIENMEGVNNIQEILDEAASWSPAATWALRFRSRSCRRSRRTSSRPASPAASASSPRPRCSRAWRRTRVRPAQRFPTLQTQSTTAPPRSCCPARPRSASTR